MIGSQLLLYGQGGINGQTPLPVEWGTSQPHAISGETLNWFYVSNLAWASATGQAAGTIVTGKLAYTRVLNSMKSALGSYNDSSFSGLSASRFNVLVYIDESVFSKTATMTPTQQAAEMAKYLKVKGDYAVDHRRGQIWGNCLAAVASDSVGYSVEVPIVATVTI